MKKEFWNQKWENNEIAFHEGVPNALLTKYFHSLSLKKGNRIFLPLCGKTIDIHWLRHQELQVVGAEWVESAVLQLFSELKLNPKIRSLEKLKHYSAEKIDIFVGDIFELNRETIGPVDAIYDRAALVALPQDIRIRYAKHLMQISENAPQLLISFEYDQNKIEGPPFSVPDSEIQKLYSKTYQTKLLESLDVRGGLKGKCPAKENIWLLR